MYRQNYNTKVGVKEQVEKQCFSNATSNFLFFVLIQNFFIRELSNMSLSTYFLVKIASNVRHNDIQKFGNYMLT